MARILVTGGNIGNHVAEGLAAKRVPVRLLVREPLSNSRSLAIEQVVCDFNDAESLAPAFAGVDKFFCVTPLAENMVQLGRNAIEAAKQAGVRHIVRSSAMGADENAITIGRWHRQIEKTLESSGIAYTILQPNAFFQNVLLSADSIKQGGAFYQPQGDGKVSHIDARDIAAVAVAALTEAGHEGKKYVLTGPEALSNHDIAKKFSNALHKEIRYVDVSKQQAEDSMRNMGMPQWMIQIYSELFEICKAGYVSTITSDVKEVLKKEPRSFDQFVRDHLGAFSEAGYGAVAH